MIVRILLFISLVLFPSRVLANPPTTQPMTPRPPVKVSVAKREAMAVDSPTWVAEHGKVQPDVLTEMARESDLADDEARLYKPGRPVGFLGTVYVAVHVQAGQGADTEQTRVLIKNAQLSVLSNLTADEFSSHMRFKDQPVVLGFVNRDGLNKLSNDAKVVAIGLDSKPHPQDPPEFFSEGIEKGADGRLAKVNPRLRSLLETHDEIFVVVNLRRGINPGASILDKVAHMQQVQLRVLSSLLATEFRTTHRITAGGLGGYVTREALPKLEAHPDVESVGLPGRPGNRKIRWGGKL